MARLLGSRCLVSIEVKLVFRFRTKLMNGGKKAAINTESSEEIYMMLTSKAIHFRFRGGGGGKTLFQNCTRFGPHGKSVAHITGKMGARAAMGYVLCQVKLKDTCFSV